MTQAYKKKLIEVAIPLEAINAASAREKSIRHGHPSTLHLWWARRPLAACRAVLFAQLVDDPSSHPDKFPTEESVEAERKRLFNIIEELVKWENSTNEEVLERARREIRNSCDGELPPVYDPFSGGASIPLEAQRLGLTAYGSDLNPVAVMIGKAMIEIPPKFKDQEPIHPGIRSRSFYRNAEGLAEDILYYANELKNRVYNKIGHLYPTVTKNNSTILAWLWARTVPSPNPAMAGAMIPLVSTYWLCRKPKKQTWLDLSLRGDKINFEVKSGVPNDPERIKSGNKSGRGANFICPFTGDAVTADYVKSQGAAGNMGWKLLAIVLEGKKGREYISPNDLQESLAFSQKPEWRPEYAMSQHPQYMSVTNYGPTNWSDLFMDRQTIAISTFMEMIGPLVEEIAASQEYKDAISTYLALGVSRLANRQSTSTFWDNGAEKIQQVFAMQALPMRWETAEGNPFSQSSGNFIGQVEYLAKAVATLPAVHNGSKLVQINAQNANFTNCVISSDPPYYDNVPYADLSDFFYVWLRYGLKNVHPDLFGTILVPKSEELVADHQRHHGKQNADTFFLDGMTAVMKNMSDNASKNYPATIYYAFRQGEVDEGGLSSTGWATFLQAIIGAGYEINSTWPVRTELTGNLKKNKNALATSVVLSCRPRDPSSSTITRTEFLRKLRFELSEGVSHLQNANVSPVDIPQAAIGPGIGVFSRYKAVLESNDTPMSVKSALQLINAQLDEFLNDLHGEFDPETRFTASWFEQNGYGKGDFGAANSLATARGIAVDSVKHAGIVESSAGKVRILKRDELDPDWDPNLDTHLTIWECCQYLLKEYEDGGESAAAMLVKKMGFDRAEAVKDLAYYLYDICSNKRQDAKEATSYNALIAGWSDITRLAASIHDTDTTRQANLDL